MNKTHASLPELQSLVHDWISQWDEGYFSPLSNLARLTEELGELARVVNHLHGDKPPKRTEALGDVGEELADMLFVMLALANSLDVDLEQNLNAVLEKYNVRDAQRFTRRDDH
ncbi:nucleotide pyrophosphohydrolase [Lujinxingia litoralis]|uniref:Nucleotide pyrophosphohydrolase n=1 Tax=Lujinxingia litoralis TaxID=2211119 RepID=A0A328CBL0_9DELT|nr:nucleotide pyrophosphohydrolase [Lujinxingia litoralis]